MDLNDLQSRLGLRFNNDALLLHALTHSSYVNEHSSEDIEDNERLEFLGDAVLDFLTAETLYKRYPDMDEGAMTRMRSALVRTESLAQVARDVGVRESMRIGKGEDINGGRERDVVLCQVFEAVIGAIYLDHGLEAVKSFIAPRLEALEAEVMDEAINKDTRSQFQEWSQAKFGLTPEFEIVSESGPAHERLYIVEATIGPKVVIAGTGQSKQAASHDAAEKAMNLINSGEMDSIFPPGDPFELDQEQ